MLPKDRLGNRLVPSLYYPHSLGQQLSSTFSVDCQLVQLASKDSCHPAQHKIDPSRYDGNSDDDTYETILLSPSLRSPISTTPYKRDTTTSQIRHSITYHSSNHKEETRLQGILGRYPVANRLELRRGGTTYFKRHRQDIYPLLSKIIHRSDQRRRSQGRYGGSRIQV
ncbi:hypothetical protein RND71_026387 [Anisodus tanguticus]|uniref:Uncharacterized protein n=1 Tax=Anisodus tanguticus TaxID=243964 RepID=A0AAE1RM46_9SOLA|nr:hypothetical protein RND71_026387 [Anisodus tanguticus]